MATKRLWRMATAFTTGFAASIVWILPFERTITSSPSGPRGDVCEWALSAIPNAPAPIFSSWRLPIPVDILNSLLSGSQLLSLSLAPWQRRDHGEIQENRRRTARIPEERCRSSRAGEHHAARGSAAYLHACVVLEQRATGSDGNPDRA